MKKSLRGNSAGGTDPGAETLNSGGKHEGSRSSTASDNHFDPDGLAGKKESKMSRKGEEAPNRFSRFNFAMGGESQILNDEKEAKPAGPKAMFADANGMKAALHENLDKKDYDVTDLYKTTGWVQALARNERFGNLTLFVIAINACWIGIDADHNDAATLADADIQYQIAENFFCIAFTFEFLVRFFSFRRKLDSLTDNWFRFDGALVGLMVAETWIIPLAVGGDGGGGMSNISIFRLLRLLRLTRLVRIMRSIPELITMLKGVAAATRSVGATLSLLIIALYVFAIIFTQQLAENEALAKAFGTIPRAMWTLLLGGTFLDNLTAVLQSIFDYGGDLAFPMVGLFLIFVLISSLTLLNMLIGVLCEVVSAVAIAEKEKVVVTYMKAQLIDVLTDLDEDGSGKISKDELSKLVEVPSAVEALEQLGVDVPNLVNLAEVIFDMEGSCMEDTFAATASQQPADLAAEGQAPKAEGIAEGQGLTNGEGGDANGVKKLSSRASAASKGAEAPVAELTFGEFLEMVLRLRAENSASVPDIVDLRKFIRWNSGRMIEKLGALTTIIKEDQKDCKTCLAGVAQRLEDMSTTMSAVNAKIDNYMNDVGKNVEFDLVVLPKAADATMYSSPHRLALMDSRGAWSEKALQDPASPRTPRINNLKTSPGKGHDL